MPNLSIGDVNLTQATFDQFKRDNEVFLLGISDIQCDHCCYTEGLLDLAWTGFKTQAHMYKGKRVKVARVDLY